MASRSSRFFSSEEPRTQCGSMCCVTRHNKERRKEPSRSALLSRYCQTPWDRQKENERGRGISAVEERRQRVSPGAVEGACERKRRLAGWGVKGVYVWKSRTGTMGR